MGKKKSVVLMTLLTIVMVVLCVLTVCPSFAIPGTVREWNPAVNQYDLGMELGGGYYAFYYPEGVISETEYENNYEMLEGEEQQEYADSYLKHKGLYLEKESIVSGDTVTVDFKSAFDAAANEIAARYAANGYSNYRVAVVDDYSIRVELPLSEVNAGTVLSQYAATGKLSMMSGGSVVDELAGKEDSITDVIKSFSVDNRYGVSYVKIKFTAKGEEMVERVKGGLTESSAGSSEATTLDLTVGGEAMLSIFKDYINDDNIASVPLAYVDNVAYVKSLCVLLDSLYENGEFEIEFKTIATSDLRTFETVYSANMLNLVYIALAVVIVALIAYSVIKMGGFGTVNGYTTISYLIIVGLCFAFISKGIFEVTLGSVLVFLVGLVLVNVLNAHIYNAVKAEFNLGKTVESSVKNGFNKTLWNVVDVYAVALLGALALLIGVAGLYTLALQAIICIVTAAFCNLLWNRAINYTLLSASKNKYKYFRFVREDDDDE
jgi:hypothetical protein